MCVIVLLDTNIYDKLACDPGTLDDIATAATAGHVRAIATPKVEDELLNSPLRGLPDWFPIETRVESVAVLDHWHLGMAKLGEGEVYSAHRGTSQKVPDAIIADSAHAYAQVFVSEDRRARRRLDESSSRCRAMDYVTFCDWLDSVLRE